MVASNTNILLLALAVAAPLVSAHGKIAVVTGNLGGNGTAFGIQGGVIPGAGENYQTEPEYVLILTPNKSPILIR